MSKRTKKYLIIGGVAVAGAIVLAKLMSSGQQQATGSTALLQGEYTPAKGVAYVFTNTADAIKNVFAAIGQKQATA